MSEAILKSILEEVKSLRKDVDEVKSSVEESSMAVEAIFDILNMEEDEGEGEQKITVGVLKAFYKAIKDRDEKVQESLKKMAVVMVSYVEASLNGKTKEKDKKEIKKDLLSLV
jgi:hypothetical protein